MFRMSKQDLSRAHVIMGEWGEAHLNTSKTSVADEEDSVFNQKGWFSDLCCQANLSRAERRKILTFIVVTSLLVMILVILSKALLLPAIIFPAIFALFHLSRRAFKRAENFERDYPAFLLSLASSVRTGMDPLAAMIASEKLFDPDSEIRRELFKFKSGIERGKSEVQTIQEFAASIRHPDIQLFRTGYLLARREGSSLAECLQRLAKVTRQRQSFRRKVKGAVAMQRLSAFGIGACAVLICAIQGLGNPKIITDALSHPLGMRLMITGVSLILVGLLWMIKMTRAHI